MSGRGVGSTSETLGRGRHLARFHAHGEESADEKDSRAPKLRRREMLVEIPGRENEGPDRAEELQGLREGNTDLADRDVIKNVRHSDAGDRRENEGAVHFRADVEWRADFSEQAGERQQKRGRDEAHDGETLN